VFAAAVILNPDHPISGLADSKKLSEKKRDLLSIEIKQHALAWAISSCSATEIDEINILQASLLAMKRAIELLHIKADLVQVDGNKCPNISLPCEAIIGGDSKVQAISAASILAKTARDAELYILDQQYPLYGFAQHKGYPTAYHLEMLNLHGVSPIHRLTYAPVRRLLSQASAA
jgi:ribonuclease HII